LSVTASHTIFLDVDGTLIDHRQTLSPAVVSAIRDARHNGHLVFVCTGRSRAEIPVHVSDIGFDGVVSAGGGFADYDGTRVRTHTLPADAVDEIVHFLVSQGIEYNLQAYDAVYPSKGLVARLAPMFAHRGVDLSAPDGEGARAAARLGYAGPPPRDGIAKATFFGENPSTFAAVRDALGHRFNVITGTMPYLGEAGGEVSLPGINKGAAIIDVVKHLDRPLSTVIAIGDSANDVEMFDVAGIGIAMGNATPVIKARAHEVTASVQEDGVPAAFRRHGLI
jgi:Cof subfamily protein (haloacid dehalogenase superfamily)